MSIFNAIKEKGYAIFDRNDFITLFDKHKKIKNNIFIDFYERITNIEKLSTEFFKKNLNNWNGYDWQGFFLSLEKQKSVCKWGFANNRSGGFWYAFLEWNYWKNHYLYIQLEQDKLCFKLSTEEVDLSSSERSIVRDELYNLIIEKATTLGFKEIRKPDRFGNGTYMTVAIVDKENWLANDKGFVNTQKVVENLTKYLKFLQEEILK